MQTPVTSAPDTATPEELARLISVLTRNMDGYTQDFQGATVMLVDEARRSAAHREEMATREHPGHFKPGAGFVYDPANGVFHVAAVQGTAEAASVMAEKLIRKERLRTSLGLNI